MPPATRSRWASGCWCWPRRAKIPSKSPRSSGWAVRRRRPPRPQKPKTAAAHRQPPGRAGCAGRATPPTTASRAPAAEPARAAGGRVKASPLARKVAAGVAASTWARCAASGPAAGSSAATSRRSSRASPRPGDAGGRGDQPAAAAAAAPRAAAGLDRPSRRWPPSASRTRGCARRSPSGCSQAKQAAPEIHLTVDIRADRIVAARDEINKHLAAEGIKVSLGDFVTKAVALALRFHPGVERQLRARRDRPPWRGQYRDRRRSRRGPDRAGAASAPTRLGLREIRVQSEALAAAARANTLDDRATHRRHVHDLEPGHVRHPAVRRDPEPARRSASSPSARPLKRPVVEGDRSTSAP